jgi:ribonuclease P protein component
MPALRPLRTRRQFLAVKAARSKSVMPGLILQARRRPPAEDERMEPCTNGAQRDVRVGFTVSRKVGNAVRRNRVKRRLRAVARSVLILAGRPGYDYVLIGRKGTVDREYADLLGDLETALERVSRGHDHGHRRQTREERQR